MPTSSSNHNILRILTRKDLCIKSCCVISCINSVFYSTMLSNSKENANHFDRLQSNSSSFLVSMNLELAFFIVLVFSLLRVQNEIEAKISQEMFDFLELSTRLSAWKLIPGCQSLDVRSETKIRRQNGGREAASFLSSYSHLSFFIKALAPKVGII